LLPSLPLLFLAGAHPVRDALVGATSVAMLWLCCPVTFSAERFTLLWRASHFSFACPKEK